MTWFIFLIIGFGVGYAVGRRAGGEGMARKRAAVLRLFDVREEISNDDVQKALGVSDATATRYLDSLEKSGDIVQVGRTGTSVHYQRRK
jgi:Fic family protein